MVPAALACVLQNTKFKGKATLDVRDLRSLVLGLVPCHGHAACSHAPVVQVEEMPIHTGSQHSMSHHLLHAEQQSLLLGMRRGLGCDECIPAGSDDRALTRMVNSPGHP